MAPTPDSPPRGPTRGLGISILARRDVAVMPAIVASLGSVALAAGVALRPGDGGTSDDVLAALALTFGVLCGIWAAVMGPARTGRRADRKAPGLLSFLVGFAILLGALTIAGLIENGLSTVAFTGVVVMAPFVGLAFPRGWSRAGIGVIVACALLVHLVKPDASSLEVASALALVVAGWFVGLIPRTNHILASRRALRLSRTDVLTRTLNRRGFLEEVEYLLQVGERAGHPIALLVIDLDEFKLVNDEHGHAEGDGLLTWVGAAIPAVLPDDAVLGRLGGDEFAVLLPGTNAADAEQRADAIQQAIAVRINASVGVATSQTGATDIDELLRTADVALYEAKHHPEQSVRIRPAAATAVDRGAAEIPPPPIAYARVRTSGPADEVSPSTFKGSWMLAGFVTIAGSGVIFVISTILWGGDSFYEELIRYGGIPWTLANLALGLGYSRKTHDVANPRFLPVYGSSVLVGTGVVTAALSTGSGVASPIIAGLYLKVFFDSSTFGRGHATVMSSIIVAFWLVALVLGPADQLWVVPFQVVMLAGSFALGTIGRSAYRSATDAQLHLARTDSLTGLLNRAGFRERVERAMRDRRDDEPLALITFDLDDFKAVNDSVGHLAGDRLLRQVADAATESLPEAFAVARYGGDEFMAALTVHERRDLDAVVRELDARLAEVTQASVGSAMFGPDGITLDALLAVADHRAYAVKERRHRGDVVPEAR